MRLFISLLIMLVNHTFGFCQVDSIDISSYVLSIPDGTYLGDKMIVATDVNSQKRDTVVFFRFDAEIIQQVNFNNAIGIIFEHHLFGLSYHLYHKVGKSWKLKHRTTPLHAITPRFMKGRMTPEEISLIEKELATTYTIVDQTLVTATTPDGEVIRIDVKN